LKNQPEHEERQYCDNLLTSRNGTALNIIWSESAAFRSAVRFAAFRRLVIFSAKKSLRKNVLWAVLGMMTLSVVFYSEIPLLRQTRERSYLSTILPIILPHILAGCISLIVGPLQFSRRFRQHNPALHRVLGRVYVISVFVSAPLGIILSTLHHDIRAIHWVAATIVQSSTWMITTAAAFLTARNGHYQHHRAWMIRSYAVTLTFVGTRVLQPFPAWNRHSEAGFSMEILVITFLAILIPDLALNWRDFISRRPRTNS
jgi:uncharacterized membrane protein